MKNIKVYTVDAFTNQVFQGNPAGVVVNAEELTKEEMQLLAREINLSETAFLLHVKDELFKIRYFTPQSEIAFCGHATVAASWILFTEYHYINQFKEIHLETSIGIVPVKALIENRDLSSVMMTQVEPKVKEIPFSIDEVINILGFNNDQLEQKYPVKLAYTGNWHLLVPFKSKEAIDQVTPDFTKLKEHNLKHQLTSTHLFTFNTQDDDYLLYTRDFAALQYLSKSTQIC